MELVIRSHEMVPWGYSVAHDHKVITVFSASSYCGTNDNFGNTHARTHTTHKWRR